MQSAHKLSEVSLRTHFLESGPGTEQFFSKIAKVFHNTVHCKQRYTIFYQIVNIINFFSTFGHQTQNYLAYLWKIKYARLYIKSFYANIRQKNRKSKCRNFGEAFSFETELLN